MSFPAAYNFRHGQVFMILENKGPLLCYENSCNPVAEEVNPDKSTWFIIP